MGRMSSLRSHGKPASTRDQTEQPPSIRGTGLSKYAKRLVFLFTGIVFILSYMTNLFDLRQKVAADMIQMLHWLHIPIPMHGDINVVVVEITELSYSGNVIRSSDAARLSTKVFEVLNSTLLPQLKHADLTPEIQEPAWIGRLPGGTDGAQAQAALTLANRIGADVIIYGTLTHTAGRIVYTPRIYLSDRQLDNVDAGELAGSYSFGQGGESLRGLNLGTNLDIKDDVKEQTQALADFLIGLAYFMRSNNPHNTNLKNAADHFRKALEEKGLRHGEGSEVLSLFLARTARRLKDLSSAQTHYEEVLAMKPDSLRARLGITEVLFQMYSRGGSCQANDKDLNTKGIQEAIGVYQSIADAPGPRGSDIKARASLYLGRAYLCMSLAEVGDHWDDAQREYSTVVADCDCGPDKKNPNPRLVPLGAEAHGDLGLLYWQMPTKDARTATENLRRAADEYGSAVRLTPDTTRRAFLSSVRAKLFVLLKECAQADEAWQKAIEDDPYSAEKYENMKQESLKDCSAK
jgi:tetratricopeptide (TPR) repeat protein